MSKILVPVDGSEPSNRAVVYAATLARALDRELDLVNVIDLRQVDVYEGFYLTDEQLEQIETQAKEKTLAASSALVPEGVKKTTRLLKGPAVKMLIAEAEKADVDQVIMGRTGKNAIERLLEGSVSRGLSLHAKKPVTLVP